MLTHPFAPKGAFLSAKEAQTRMPEISMGVRSSKFPVWSDEMSAIFDRFDKKKQAKVEDFVNFNC